MEIIGKTKIPARPWRWNVVAPLRGMGNLTVICLRIPSITSKLRYQMDLPSGIHNPQLCTKQSATKHTVFVAGHGFLRGYLRNAYHTRNFRGIRPSPLPTRNWKALGTRVWGTLHIWNVPRTYEMFAVLPASHMMPYGAAGVYICIYVIFVVVHTYIHIKYFQYQSPKNPE